MVGRGQWQPQAKHEASSAIPCPASGQEDPFTQPF